MLKSCYHIKSLFLFISPDKHIICYAKNHALNIKRYRFNIVQNTRNKVHVCVSFTYNECNAGISKTLELDYKCHPLCAENAKGYI